MIRSSWPPNDSHELLYKNHTHLISTFWWIWTYPYTYDTVTATKVLNIFTLIASKNFLVFVYVFRLYVLGKNTNMTSILVMYFKVYFFNSTNFKRLVNCRHCALQLISRASSTCLIETRNPLKNVSLFPLLPALGNHHSILWFHEPDFASVLT